MNYRNSVAPWMLIALVFLCLQISVSGQTTSQVSSRLASVRAEGTSVRWEPAISYSSVTLTVSGPDGSVFRRQFPAGASPSFSLFDKTGALREGHYTYELTFTQVTQGFKENLSMAPDEAAAATVAATEQGRSSNRQPLATQPMVQSGSFAVLNGSLYVGNETEPTVAPKGSDKGGLKANPDQANAITPADIVQADDVIIQGSLCVGLDCVVNESFGFDTIRLKENNTRIKFEDTSVVPFPTTDWQLTANDSASGGANKFSIEDITDSKVPFTITGNAPSNSIFVDSTGRLGLRTSTPVLDVHAATGNTPAIRLEQNSSGGFTAQTWDIAGNEANFFVRDVTGGSRLPFRIRPGAPTSSIDINATGQVGIGTASPANQLDVFKTQDAATIANVSNTNNSTASQAIFQVASDIAKLDFRVHATARTVTRYGVTLGGYSELIAQAGNGLLIGTFTNATPIIFGTNGAERMRILANGRVGIGTAAPDQLFSVNGDASKTGTGSWLSFSDERLKNIKGHFNSGLKAVMQLQPIRYEYKRDNALGLVSAGEHVGFAAQALQKVIPEAVTKNADGYLMVNNDPILWTMLNAIKEQQKEIAELKAQVERLRAASHRRRK